jgi:hypothetical protein
MKIGLVLIFVGALAMFLWQVISSDAYGCAGLHHYDIVILLKKMILVASQEGWTN